MSNPSDFIIENGVLKKYNGPGGDVVVPDGVAEIGGGYSGAFHFCSSLTSVTLPQGVTTIGSCAFHWCRNLKTVTLPDTLKKIGREAFIDCSELTGIALPEGLECIEEKTFSECRSLATVALPKSLKEIKANAFSGCGKLTTVLYPGTSEDWKSIAIDPSCVNLRLIMEGEVRVEGKNGFVWTLDRGGRLTVQCAGECEGIPGAEDLKTTAQELILKEGITKISFSAFDGYVQLRSIVIPDTVSEIMAWAFNGCSKLEEVTTPIVPISGEMFGRSGKTVILNITEPGQETKRVMASFRKEYWAQSWSYPKDYLLPLSEEAIPYYDRLVAGGSYDGFNMNENGRIRAALWRLEDKEFPVAEELRGQFADFLSSKLNKAIKFAEEDAAPQYIQTLIDVGTINADNLKKVGKTLAKSAMPEIQAFASKLTPASASKAASVEAGPELPFSKQLKKLKAPALLLKYSIDKLPEVLLADGSGPAPEDYLRYILAEYITQAKKNEAVLIRSADEAAQKLDKKSLQTALRTIYDSIFNEKQQLALLPVLFRYADGSVVRELYPKNRNTRWKEDAANLALLLSDTREAMLYADKYKLLPDYAELRGTDADFLRDTVLAEFGLDEKGTKTYDLGAMMVTAKLSPDLKLELHDEKAGKTVKSIPKKNADPDKFEAAKADFDELKKNIKTAAKNRANQLFEAFLSGTRYVSADWQAVYLKNPVLNRVARLVIWSQGAQTFTLTENGPIDSGEKPAHLADEPIRVAHPMEMAADDVRSWQQYFAAKGLKQPFLQVWEPICTAEEIQQDRYAGCRIPYYRFLGQERHGIFVRDFDFHNDIEITLSGCSAIVERLDWRRHEIDVNDCFEVRTFRPQKLTRQVNHIVAYLDRITVWDRVRKDDLSVMEIMDRFTLAQITEFIAAAQEANAASVLAALLDYKNANFADFDPMDEFTLEW